MKWALLIPLTYFAGAEGFALFACYLAFVLVTVRFIGRFRQSRLASA